MLEVSIVLCLQGHSYRKQGLRIILRPIQDRLVLISRTTQVYQPRVLPLCLRDRVSPLASFARRTNASSSRENHPLGRFPMSRSMNASSGFQCRSCPPAKDGAFISLGSASEMGAVSCSWQQQTGPRHGRDCMEIKKCVTQRSIELNYSFKTLQFYGIL